jgi:hypothetical membrane protein
MMRKMLLGALISVPIFYYFALIAGAATYPGYSHVTRYASELGAADAPHPALFNIPIIIGGIAALLGAFGLALALRDLSGRSTWAMAAGIALALWGMSMVMGGMFPMPNNLHGGFGLGLLGPLVPVFALLALRNVPDTRGIKMFLAFIFVGSIIVLAIMFRRRPSSDAPKRRHLAADKYRYLDSMAGGAWILVVSADGAAI